MMTKFVPVDDALVLRLGSVQDFRDRLDASMKPAELPKARKALASIRDLFPHIAKVPTIREVVLG